MAELGIPGIPDFYNFNLTTEDEPLPGLDQPRFVADIELALEGVALPLIGSVGIVGKGRLGTWKMHFYSFLSCSSI